MILKKINNIKAAELFYGWEEALIWSCLQGHMGSIILDDEENPRSAMISIGDFCFFAGVPNDYLFNDIEGFKLLILKDNDWEALIKNFCSQFRDYDDYQSHAIGVAILHNGKLVSGASPYAVYDNGIEIERDTKPEYRGKGLATVCGAKIILECLKSNVYPSWDSHDLRSVALAEKLGYHLSHPYVTYELL